MELTTLILISTKKFKKIIIIIGGKVGKIGVDGGKRKRKRR